MTGLDLMRARTAQAPPSATAIHNGVHLRFERRRYGSKTYTWTYWWDGQEWQSCGDPWKRPASSDHGPDQRKQLRALHRHLRRIWCLPVSGIGGTVMRPAKEVADELWEVYLSTIKAIRADESKSRFQRAVDCCKAWDAYSAALNERNIYPSLAGYRYRVNQEI